MEVELMDLQKKEEEADEKPIKFNGKRFYPSEFKTPGQLLFLQVVKAAAAGETTITLDVMTLYGILGAYMVFHEDGKKWRRFIRSRRDLENADKEMRDAVNTLYSHPATQPVEPLV